VFSGVDPGSWGSWHPWKYVGGTRVCFDPLKMSHSFIQNCWWITAIFTLSRNKDLCEKLLEAPTGCQEPGLLSVWKSLTWGVIWNSLTAVTWVTLTPCYTTDVHHCRRSMRAVPCTTQCVLSSLVMCSVNQSLLAYFMTMFSCSVKWRLFSSHVKFWSLVLICQLVNCDLLTTDVSKMWSFWSVLYS